MKEIIRYILVLSLFTIGIIKAETDDLLLLVAHPEKVGSGVFKKSVVVAKMHGRDSGTVGLILNRKSTFSLDQILVDNQPFLQEKKYLFRGGPVSPKMLVYLYQNDQPRADALAIGNDYSLTFSHDSISDLLADRVKHSRIRVYNGYVGWHSKQLRQEISDGKWIALPFNKEVLFTENPEQLWDELVKPYTGNWI